MISRIVSVQVRHVPEPPVISRRDVRWEEQMLSGWLCRRMALSSSAHAPIQVELPEVSRATVVCKVRAHFKCRPRQSPRSSRHQAATASRSCCQAVTCSSALCGQLRRAAGPMNLPPPDSKGSRAGQDTMEMLEFRCRVYAHVRVRV